MHTELRLLFALVVVALVVALPQPTVGRKLAAFVLVPLVMVGALLALYVVPLLAGRWWFLHVGQARLIQALAHPRAEVRAEAATALGLRGTDATGAVAALRSAADDPDAGVRRAALHALASIEAASAAVIRHARG